MPRLTDEQLSVLVSFRQPIPEDGAFIFKTFCESLFHNQRLMTNSWFIPVFRQILEHLLSNPEVQVLVASSTEDPNHIYGYIIFNPERRIMYFNYVKLDFRKMGCGSHLMKLAFGDFRTPIVTPFSTSCVPYYRARWNLQVDSSVLLTE